MLWVLIIGSIVGIVGIFVIRYKETQQKNKIKVRAERKTATTFKEDAFDNNDDYEPSFVDKRSIDYAKLNKLISQAEILYSKDLLEQASKIYVQALAIDPDHEIANNKLGLIYLKRDMPSKSEAIYRLLVKIKPRNAVYYSNLALSLYNQGFLEEAKKNYKKSIELDPKKESRYISLGQVCVDKGDTREAINSFSRALELNPENNDMYFYITNLLIEVKAWDEAMAFMQAFLDNNPYNEDAKQRIIDIKRMKGDDPLYQG
jgi:tetratricopeptide (TPR) repeat protein